MNAPLFSHWNMEFPPVFASLAMRTLIEYSIYCGAILLVAAVFFFWAVAVRQPRKRKHRHHWRTGSRKKSADPGPDAESAGHRRRSELPRNPTLAETRGLPPLRDQPDDSTQPPQQ